MQLNADFTQRAVVHAATLEWTPSPIAGVERRMLDRTGGEVARATSIVRYAPHSHFSRHVHVGGEEFFVLEGVFQDEHGDYPAGSYVRNPPTSAHTPGSQSGCTILVKLWQFDAADRTQVRIDTTKCAYQRDPLRTGVEAIPLYQGVDEVVALERGERTLGSLFDRRPASSWLSWTAISRTRVTSSVINRGCGCRRGHWRKPR